ncbi:15809_t:CDS:2, partial [Funneliformis caledonium]
FSHPKNVEEAIDAAKQVENGQYYEQQSPILTQPSGNNNAINNLTKQIANEAPDDELEQVLDDYKEEELSEIEAYMADSQEEYEEETDLLPLDYNP